MQNKTSSPVLPFQDEPAAQHRRQVFWQVWVPIIATIIVVLFLAVLATVATGQGSNQVNRWGNISAVLLLVPVLLVGLVFMALFGAVVYGIHKLNQKVPGWLLKVQLFMVHLALSVRRAADTATKPIFAVNTFTTRATTLLDRIFHRRPAAQ